MQLKIAKQIQKIKAEFKGYNGFFKAIFYDAKM